MDPFVAEIRIFPFNFAPRGWAWCSGQLLPLAQNTALFSLLGTTYGGNGSSNFGLPNLQGNAPMFYGQGPGLSLYNQGESGGTESVTILQNQMPNHTHTLRGTNELAEPPNTPGNASMATSSLAVYSPATANTTMSPTTLANAGGNLPHNNMMPYLTYYFNIAMQGVFPPRQ